MTLHRFVNDEEVEQIYPLGEDIKLLVVVEGAPTDGRKFRFEHLCKPRLGDDGGRMDIICAPSLQEGHRASWQDDIPTITPSILCPDCNTHGFVTNGTWNPA